VLNHERSAKKGGYSIIIGVDEAGRGPLAGPVVAAAVCLQSLCFFQKIDDSKRLSPRQRQMAFFEIAQKAVYDTGVVNAGAIDSLNIARATKLAAEIAVTRLLGRLKAQTPTLENTILLLDGRIKTDLSYSSKEIIGGDRKSLSIAAASIIAKVIRDRMMEIYDRVFPQYGFKVHKGYGTKDHFERIARFGISALHRRSFSLKQ
jgi:ribonuclease HII